MRDDPPRGWGHGAGEERRGAAGAGERSGDDSTNHFVRCLGREEGLDGALLARAVELELLKQLLRDVLHLPRPAAADGGRGRRSRHPRSKPRWRPRNPPRGGAREEGRSWRVVGAHGDAFGRSCQRSWGSVTPLWLPDTMRRSTATSGRVHRGPHRNQARHDFIHIQRTKHDTGTFATLSCALRMSATPRHASTKGASASWGCSPRTRTPARVARERNNCASRIASALRAVGSSRPCERKAPRKQPQDTHLGAGSRNLNAPLSSNFPTRAPTRAPRVQCVRRRVGGGWGWGGMNDGTVGEAAGAT